MNERREFGAALRHERERRGISLDDVAEQTKINMALLAGLERADLARWPNGIFRRAFVRGYASAIGLDPDAVVTSFTRLFPEGCDDRVVNVPVFDHVAAPRDGLRLTLASHPRPSVRVWGLRAAAVALDFLVLGACGAVVALAGVAPFSAAALSTAALYFGVGTLALEASPGWWVTRRWVRARPSVPDIEIALDAEAAALDAQEAAQRRQAPEQALRGNRRERRAARQDRHRVVRGARRLS